MTADVVMRLAHLLPFGYDTPVMMGPFRDARVSLVPVRSGLRSALTIVLVLAFVGGAFAQQAYWYHGRVLWISGNTMGFAPDGGGSFDVDLKGVDQSSYAYLKSGDGVTVVGVVSPNGQTLIGQSVIRDPPYQSLYIVGGGPPRRAALGSPMNTAEGPHAL